MPPQDKFCTLTTVPLKWTRLLQMIFRCQWLNNFECTTSILKPQNWWEALSTTPCLKRIPVLNKYLVLQFTPIRAWSRLGGGFRRFCRQLPTIPPSSKSLGCFFHLLWCNVPCFLSLCSDLISQLSNRVSPDTFHSSLFHLHIWLSITKNYPIY